MSGTLAFKARRRTTLKASLVKAPGFVKAGEDGYHQTRGLKTTDLFR